MQDDVTTYQSEAPVGREKWMAQRSWRDKMVRLS
jgi:hypothetical protein